MSFRTTLNSLCGGAAEDWASCYDKASDACNKKYIVISKGVDSRGIKRELTFSM